MNHDAADDDRAAFEALYRNAAKDLYCHARLALDRESANDLVQVVFEVAWKQRADVLCRDLDGQRAWLYTVLHYKMVDDGRRSRRHTSKVADVGHELMNRQRQASMGLESVLLADLVAQSWKVIDTMPKVRRQVFYLRAQGYKPGEIATCLGRTATAVSNLLAAGKRDLAKAVGPANEVFGIDDEDGGEG